MKKIILNKCYGGFGVSSKGYKLYAEKLNLPIFRYDTYLDPNSKKITYKKVSLDSKESVFVDYVTKDLGDEVEYVKDKLDLDTHHREDPLLIEVVEELGKDANTSYSDLVIVEVPDDVAEDYMIDDYDGVETLHKRVQVW